MSIIKRNKLLNFFIVILSIFLIKTSPIGKDKPEDLDLPDEDIDNRPPNLKNNIFNNNKIDKFDDLKKKHKYIIQENINSKAKLKKYNLYCSIIEKCNIIFALS